VYRVGLKKVFKKLNSSRVTYQNMTEATRTYSMSSPEKPLRIAFVHPDLGIGMQASACLSIRLSVCLSFCPSICLSINLSMYLSVYMSVSLVVNLSVCLSIYLSFCLSICLSVCMLSTCLPVCLSVFTYVCLSVYVHRFLHVRQLSLSVCALSSTLDRLRWSREAGGRCRSWSTTEGKLSRTLPSACTCLLNLIVPLALLACLIALPYSLQPRLDLCFSSIFSYLLGSQRVYLHEPPRHRTLLRGDARR
jgi:hypothetical protein